MDEYYSTKQVAKMLNVNPISVRRWINQGILPAFSLGKLNKEYRISKTDLENFINQRKVKK